MLRMIFIAAIVLGTYLLIDAVSDLLVSAKGTVEKAQTIEPDEDTPPCVSTYNNAGVATRCTRPLI